MKARTLPPPRGKGLQLQNWAASVRVCTVTRSNSLHAQPWDWEASRHFGSTQKSMATGCLITNYDNREHSRRAPRLEPSSRLSCTDSPRRSISRKPVGYIPTELMGHKIGKAISMSNDPRAKKIKPICSVETMNSRSSPLFLGEEPTCMQVCVLVHPHPQWHACAQVKRMSSLLGALHLNTSVSARGPKCSQEAPLQRDTTSGRRRGPAVYHSDVISSHRSTELRIPRTVDLLRAFLSAETIVESSPKEGLSGGFWQE